MMRRGNPTKKNHGAPPADLLFCFPTLKPKQICSPARLSDPTIHRSHLNKLSSTRLGAGTSGPVLWDNDKNVGSDASEPNSPKVTCAGQIKVQPTEAAGRKSWQSVMEEIERIHIKNKKQKSRASWGDALGFLNWLRSIKLDFRCFRAMPECDISSDEDEDEVDNLNDKEDKSSENKWFMYLQENQDTIEPVANQNDKETDTPSAAPPPNALLLMRCRSAPAKSWLENRARVIVEQEERDKKTQQQQQQNEEEETEEKQRLSDYLVVMEYDTDFYKLSNDIAKETWVVGSINPNNPFPKSRSWKR